MLWNTPLTQLRGNYDRLVASQLLEQTARIHADLKQRGTPHDPIDYLQIPPAVHDIGKLVIPYVHIKADGLLDKKEPAFYAVTSRPNALPDHEAAAARSREVHVYAEHRSFERGLLTPYARARSEVEASQLIPNVYLGDYIDDRTQHLAALHDEALNPDKNGITKTQRDTIVEGIDYAIKALQQRRES